MSSVSVVIPHYNRRELLGAVLKQFRDQTYPIEEVIVVDNGSTDGSDEVAVREGARVIRLPLNQGFAAAVNRGIEAAQSGLIAVSNNDVELDRQWLRRLVEVLHDDAVWFATGKCFDANARDRIDGSFDLMCRGGSAWRAGAGFLDAPDWNAEREIAFAPWTAAVFRRELFQKVGMLDEVFGSYLEDVEFGLRCAAAGLRGRYVPKALAWHAGSQTLGRWSPEQVRRISRNQLILIARHFPHGWIWRYGRAVIVAQLLWGLLSLRHGALLAWLTGKMEGLRDFRMLRRYGNASVLEPLLRESEAMIKHLQQRNGADWYWRWYFRLT